MLKVGSVIDNKYKILSEVGHGGMSTVYLAINERANKTWAVKEVRKDGTFDFEGLFRQMKALSYRGVYLVEVYRNSYCEASDLVEKVRAFTDRYQLS